jgi:tetratricopeptide (TPR) repeat protein
VVAEAAKPHPIWTIIAAFFLTVSLSLTADIARRFLAVGADFVGVFSTLFQGFLTFLAGRSLTEAGQRSLERTLSRFNIARRYSYIANTTLALLVLLLVIALRLSLPTIARYYNDQGVRLQQSNQVSSAILSYQRAVSLSPFYAQAHYNLGTAYEQSLANDLAISSYQAALRIDSRNIPAYNNLARVYLASTPANYGNALTLLNIALDLDQTTPQPDKTILRYSLYKNRGWANLGLGFLGQAENDVREAMTIRPEGAAAHCLLAQVLDARKENSAALSEWELCLAYEKLDTFVPAEARWLGLARERLSEDKQK